MRSRSFIYGPVPSRRLGRSLGVELVPYKTCSYDCIYCQLGRTTHKTIERRSWVAVDVLLEQIKDHLGTQPDWITLAGSGEPTLHANIGDLIERIKGMTDIPVAVLTNGSLLWSPEVRKSLCKADMVAPSLDAGSPGLFHRVNRPHESIPFELMIQGLIDFRKEYEGQYWLEVFLLEGLTGMIEPVEEIAKIVEKIDPDRVQLNTVVRPPAESSAMPVPGQLLECYAVAFGDKAEVIADFSATAPPSWIDVKLEEILEMVSRRPCTVDDISCSLGIHRTEVMKYLERLSKAGQVQCEYLAWKLFFKANQIPCKSSDSVANEPCAP